MFLDKLASRIRPNKDYAKRESATVTTPVPLDYEFVVRSDAKSKVGGDTYQIERYVEQLRTKGAAAVISPWRPSWRPSQAKAILAVNVDRPFEVLHVARRVESSMLYVVPIHHSFESIDRLRAHESSTSGVRVVMSRLPRPMRELLAFIRRVLLSGDWPRFQLTAALQAIADSVVLKRRISGTLSSSAGVLVLAASELRSIELDYNIKLKRYVIVPNGLPDSPKICKAWDERSGVVVAGRIEPRKRQLELLRAAERLGEPLVFCGDISPDAPGYGAKFADEVREASFCRWLGPLSHTEMMSVLSGSRVLLNGSWAEVQSLVELEAASRGCYVVTIDGASSAEYLGSIGKVLDPTMNAEQLVRAALSLAREKASPGEFRYTHTWSTAADSIDELVRLSLRRVG